MIDLDDRIKDARRQFESLWSLAQAAGTSCGPHVEEALQQLSTSLEELETLQEELRCRNEELVAARAKANAEEERYHELFDSAPDGYLLTDRYGKIEELNLAAATLLNVRRDFAVGKALTVFVEEPLHDTITEIITRGQIRNRSLTLRPREQSSVPVSIAAAVKNLVEGNLQIRWIMRDVTERQNSEWMLRDKTEQYRLLFENAVEGLCRSTPEGRFIAVNPALAKMLGYQSPDEMLSLGIAQDIFVDAGERGRLLREVENSPEGALRGREVLLKKKDGAARIASISIRAVKGPQGKPVAYESQVQDVTERKALEERLRQRERLAAVGATVAVLAHEISNPLTGMCTIIDMMARHLASQGQQQGDLAPFLTGLRTETQRLTALLHDFRVLAQYQYTFQPVSIQELVAEMIAMQGAVNSQIVIKLDLPGSLPQIHADRNKLKQALLNLWKNGIEAMPEGGTLTLKAITSKDRLVVEVKDTGEGVRAGIDVFEPFTTTKEEGTGLGLAIVRQVILAHGGAVNYNSEPGKGTTFRLSLPINPSPE